MKSKKLSAYVEAVEYGIQRELLQEEIIGDENDEYILYINPRKVLSNALAFFKDNKPNVVLLQLLIKEELKDQIFTKRK